MAADLHRSAFAILLTLVISFGARAGDLGAEAYCLPLVEPYGVYRSDASLGAARDGGLYRLVEVMPSGRGGGLSTRTLVSKVETVAVRDRVIFGKSAEGFFILDAREAGPRPRVLSTRDAWEAALRGVGILDPNVVKVPDALAVGVPDRVLRPWKYRMGGRRFGISDDMLSLVVQVLGLMFAFVLGLTWRGKSLMAAAIALGVIVNVVAQMVIAGGGPGAFVGFVVLPVLCMLAAAFGRGVRARVS
jgi:hypothetical protein